MANSRIAKRLATIAACLGLCVMSSAAQAQEWDWTIAPYLWGSGTTVDVFINDEPVIGGDLSFSDLLDKLDMGAQLHFEGRRDTLGFFFDFTYLDTSDSTTLEANPPLPGGTRLESVMSAQSRIPDSIPKNSESGICEATTASMGMPAAIAR